MICSGRRLIRRYKTSSSATKWSYLRKKSSLVVSRLRTVDRDVDRVANRTIEEEFFLDSSGDKECLEITNFGIFDEEGDIVLSSIEEKVSDTF